MSAHQVARQLAIGNVLERLSVIRAMEPEGEALLRAATDLFDAGLAIYLGALTVPSVWPSHVVGAITPETPWGEARRAK